jgi:hypothetical protein
VSDHPSHMVFLPENHAGRWPVAPADLDRKAETV